MAVEVVVVLVDDVVVENDVETVEDVVDTTDVRVALYVVDVVTEGVVIVAILMSPITCEYGESADTIPTKISIAVSNAVMR